MPLLKPAVFSHGKTFTGPTHDEIMKSHSIKEGQRGFISEDGKFMNRSASKLYLKSKNRDLYDKWAKTAGGEDQELHAMDLEDAGREPIDLSKKKALVLDLGLFTENACRIGRDVAECFYWTNWADPFPEAFQVKIGEGLEGIERVTSYHEYLDKVDLIFVPDTLFAEEVEWLKAHEYPVAGAGASERLELDRWYGRMVQKDNDLPTQETYKIQGIEALRKFTKDHKHFWVKIDAIRGLEETWSYEDEKDCEQTIDNIAAKLGPYKDEIKFICEEKLDGKEPGLDGVTFDGELLYPTMIGYEGKSVGVIERVYRRPDDLPEPAKMVAEGFAPEFKKNKTRFFFSFEFIVGKDKAPFVIDPSIRLAAPGVCAIQSELFENYTEVIYGLATGQKIRPVIKWKYAAAAAMESSAAEKNWVNVNIPPEIRQWVKLRTAVKHGKEYYALPGLDSLGTVIGFGNTVDEALNLVEERAEQVTAKRINRGIDDLKKMKKDIEEGKQNGIDF